MRSGTRIELHGMPTFPGFPGVAPEQATICQWRERINGPRMDGWHIVKFVSDGGRLCVHESNFRVIDNAA